MKNSREVVLRYINASISAPLRDLADFYATEVTIEMPFGQPLYPEYIETSRDELRLKFDDAAAARRYSRVENVVVHETTDPEIVIAEYSLHGETLAAPHHSFVMPLIMVMTIREGVIVHTRDYNSPVARAQSLGTVPQLIAILQQIDVNQNAGDTKKAQ